MSRDLRPGGWPEDRENDIFLDDIDLRRAGSTDSHSELVDRRPSRAESTVYRGPRRSLWRAAVEDRQPTPELPAELPHRLQRAFSVVRTRTPEVVDPSSLRAGLEAALGRDGNGKWLADDDHIPANLSADRVPDLDPFDADDGLGRPMSPGAFASAFGSIRRGSVYSRGDSYLGDSSRRDSYSRRDHYSSRGDSLRLVEEARSHSPLSVVDPGVSDLAATVVSISSRVLNGSTPPPIRESPMLSPTNMPRMPSPLMTAGPPGPSVPDGMPSMVSGKGPGPDAKMRPEPVVGPQMVEVSVSDTLQTEPEHSRPLIGNSLRIFTPHNKLRRFLHFVVVQPWVDPLIFVLILIQTVLLSYQSANNIFTLRPDGPLFLPWGRSWLDWVFFGIFIAYTVEMVSKIIVYGLIDDSQASGAVQDIKQRLRGLLRLRPHVVPTAAHPVRDAPVVTKSFTNLIHVHSSQTAERAYLRSSWNRVDFVAVVSWWISFVLQTTGVENNNQFFVFRALSCLRILRLLNLTYGTSSVLRGLKKAIPLLANVVLFMGFFWYV
jgi:hypothetical protein